MWTILEHRSLDRQLKKIPGHIVEKYEVWKNIVKHGGPQALRNIRGFRDEALAGEWAGYRSSRLDQAYRVIYQIEREAVSVFVERVNKHDYR